MSFFHLQKSDAPIKLKYQSFNSICLHETEKAEENLADVLKDWKETPQATDLEPLWVECEILRHFEYHWDDENKF